MACCSHDHDCEAASCGEASLYSHINHTGVTCLNAVDTSQAPRILRPWHERRACEACLESPEDDAELLLHIPFTTDVKVRRLLVTECPYKRLLIAPCFSVVQLRGIMVAGGGDGTSPTVMRAFINRDDIDFGMAADLSPVQEFSLTEDATASLEYATKIAKFQSVSSLTLHFNGGAPCTRLHFVGLRGEVRSSVTTLEQLGNALQRSQGSGLKREPPLNIVYEAKPQPQDHKVGDATTLGARMLQ
jgi:hypothetical protein